MNVTVTIQIKAGVTEQINIFAPSLMRILCYNQRFSYSGGECSAHKNHYTSSHITIPGNPVVPDSPKCLLLIISITDHRQTFESWPDSVSKSSDMLDAGTGVFYMKMSIDITP